MLQENNQVVSSFNILLKKKQINMDNLSNLQREKDFKVQRIEKKYESKIEDCLRIENAIDMQIELAKKYIVNDTKKESF